MSKPLPPSGSFDDPQILSGPFWGELRVFLAVAKARSFNRAAEALNMSQPTVSRQVRRLQDVMGAQLVIPTQTGIMLTRQGEELAKSLEVLDHTLFEISHDLTAETRNAEGTVRLVASEAMAGLFIAPALLSFNELYPKIRLEIYSPQDYFSFRPNRADVMLSVVPVVEPGIVSSQLGYLHLLPVAFRPYIERYGVPTSANLSSHCFLQATACSQRDGLWDSWLDLIGKGVVTHTCDNLITYSMMVKVGLGIGLVSTCALSDPQAVPLELGVHIRVPLYAIAPAERLGTRAVRVVYDWVSEIFAPTVPWFSSELKLDHLPNAAMTTTVDHLLGGPGRNP